MIAYRASVRDSLVLRDNRPMATGAGQAPSMDIPWPSTIAGLVRTRLGERGERGHFVGDPIALRKVAVAGPWLVRERDGMRFFPAPRDAVWFREMRDGTEHSFIRRLVPRAKSDKVLYSGNLTEVVGFTQGEETRAKSFAGARFWSAAAISRWNNLGEAPKLDSDELLVGFEEEMRTHVALSDKRTALEGQLFATGHRRFLAKQVKKGSVESFSIGFATATDQKSLAPGAAPMGGERRMVSLEAEPKPHTDLVVPKVDGDRMRITLLTPAIFTEGAIPRELAGAKVVAAIVPRPEVISGWDFEKRGPKPTRRVVSAGAVFWVETDNVAALTEKLWMHAISSEQQDCLDGFGLAIVGRA